MVIYNHIWNYLIVPASASCWEGGEAEADVDGARGAAWVDGVVGGAHDG